MKAKIHIGTCKAVQKHQIIHLKVEVYTTCNKGLTCRQQGHQQLLHLSGLDRWITSWFWLFRIFMSKGRELPQQFLVQQQVSVETECIHKDIAPSLLLDIKQAQTFPVTDRRLQNQTDSSWYQVSVEIGSKHTDTTWVRNNRHKDTPGKEAGAYRNRKQT